MAKSKDSNEGCFTAFAVLVIIGLIAAIPKPVWITLGILVAAGLVTWLVVALRNEAAQRRIREAEQAELARQERERAVVQQRKIDLGRKNAKAVESAESAVAQVIASEAAREGWLGDVDFSADLAGITDSFRRAQALRQKADDLARLKNASDDDRRILAEARTASERLENSANERVRLIARCATEAGLIDESLRKEREDARTAEQRAELHRDLNSMLYGIEVTPPADAAESAASQVMARVAGYREIKQQIALGRDVDRG